jgi:hypothetical protein
MHADQIQGKLGLPVKVTEVVEKARPMPVNHTYYLNFSCSVCLIQRWLIFASWEEGKLMAR